MGGYAKPGRDLRVSHAGLQQLAAEVTAVEDLRERPERIRGAGRAVCTQTSRVGHACAQVLRSKLHVHACSCVFLSLGVSWRCAYTRDAHLLFRTSMRVSMCIRNDTH